MIDFLVETTDLNIVGNNFKMFHFAVGGAKECNNVGTMVGN